MKTSGMRGARSYEHSGLRKLRPGYWLLATGFIKQQYWVAIKPQTNLRHFAYSTKRGSAKLDRSETDKPNLL